MSLLAHTIYSYLVNVDVKGGIHPALLRRAGPGQVLLSPATDVPLPGEPPKPQEQRTNLQETAPDVSIPTLLAQPLLYEAATNHQQLSLFGAANDGNTLAGFTAAPGTLVLHHPTGVHQDIVGTTVVDCCQPHPSWDSDELSPVFEAHPYLVHEAGRPPSVPGKIRQICSTFDGASTALVTGTGPAAVLEPSGAVGLLAARTLYTSALFVMRGPQPPMDVYGDEEAYVPPALQRIARLQYQQALAHVTWNPHLTGELATVTEGGVLQAVDVTFQTEDPLTSEDRPQTTFLPGTARPSWAPACVATRAVGQCLKSTAPCLDRGTRSADGASGSAVPTSGPRGGAEEWWRCEYGAHPRTLVLANRRGASLVDLRERRGGVASDASSHHDGSAASPGMPRPAGNVLVDLDRDSYVPERGQASWLHQLSSRSLPRLHALGTMWERPPGAAPCFLFGVATQDCVLLYDTRRPSCPLLQWEHYQRHHQPPSLLHMYPAHALGLIAPFPFVVKEPPQWYDPDPTWVLPDGTRGFFGSTSLLLREPYISVGAPSLVMPPLLGVAPARAAQGASGASGGPTVDEFDSPDGLWVSSTYGGMRRTGRCVPTSGWLLLPDVSYESGTSQDGSAATGDSGARDGSQESNHHAGVCIFQWMDTGSLVGQRYTLDRGQAPEGVHMGTGILGIEPLPSAAGPEARGDEGGAEEEAGGGRQPQGGKRRRRPDSTHAGGGPAAVGGDRTGRRPGKRKRPAMLRHPHFLTVALPTLYHCLTAPTADYHPGSAMAELIPALFRTSQGRGADSSSEDGRGQEGDMSHDGRGHGSHEELGAAMGLFRGLLLQAVASLRAPATLAEITKMCQSLQAQKALREEVPSDGATWTVLLSLPQGGAEAGATRDLSSNKRRRGKGPATPLMLRDGADEEEGDSPCHGSDEEEEDGDDPRALVLVDKATTHGMAAAAENHFAVLERMPAHVAGKGLTSSFLLRKRAYLTPFPVQLLFAAGREQECRLQPQMPPHQPEGDMGAATDGGTLSQVLLPPASTSSRDEISQEPPESQLYLGFSQGDFPGFSQRLSQGLSQWSSQGGDGPVDQLAVRQPGDLAAHSSTRGHTASLLVTEASVAQLLPLVDDMHSLSSIVHRGTTDSRHMARSGLARSGGSSAALTPLLYHTMPRAGWKMPEQGGGDTPNRAGADGEIPAASIRSIGGAHPSTPAPAPRPSTLRHASPCDSFGAGRGSAPEAAQGQGPGDKGSGTEQGGIALDPHRALVFPVCHPSKDRHHGGDRAAVPGTPGGASVGHPRWHGMDLLASPAGMGRSHGASGRDRGQAERGGGGQGAAHGDAYRPDYLAGMCPHRPIFSTGPDRLPVPAPHSAEEELCQPLLAELRARWVAGSTKVIPPPPSRPLAGHGKSRLRGPPGTGGNPRTPMTEKPRERELKKPRHSLPLSLEGF
eukprot:jgi/Mesvir1/23814/Mv10626-RA.1